MATIRVGDLDIAYRRAGSGPALMLVHAAAADGRMWGPQLAALSRQSTVVAWDEPGAGRSADLPPGFTLGDHARCLAGLIEALDLGPAHVAGLSWGGTVALELYRLRPELVASLILADTYAGWKGSLPAAEVAARLEAVDRMLVAPADAFVPAFPGLFAGSPSAECRDLLAAMDADVRKHSLAANAASMAAADLRGVLPTITVPTLLIWGELDARSGLDVARQFADAIIGSTLVVIPECGHMSNLEQPERFNQAVRRFVSSSPVPKVSVQD